MRSGLSDSSIPPRLWIERLGSMGALAVRSMVELFTPGPSWLREFAIQAIFIFKIALPPVLVVNFATGFSASGIQTGGVLDAFGAIDRAGAAVPIAFLREIGAFLTASIIAGSVGATITSELGARKIREEIDALSVLGVNIVRNLVLPRIAALVAVIPVLNLFALCAGFIGSYVGVVILYTATPEAFTLQFLANTSFIDLYASQLKIVIFGFMIGVIACQKGLSVSGGAEGVGRAVNESVVACLLGVLLVTIVYTQLFLAIYPDVSVQR